MRTVWYQIALKTWQLPGLIKHVADRLFLESRGFPLLPGEASGTPTLPLLRKSCHSSSDKILAVSGLGTNHILLCIRCSHLNTLGENRGSSKIVISAPIMRSSIADSAE